MQKKKRNKRKKKNNPKGIDFPCDVQNIFEGFVK